MKYLAFICLFYSLTILNVSAEVECTGKDGNAVEWWIALKPAKTPSYFYWDSSSTEWQWIDTEEPNGPNSIDSLVFRHVATAVEDNAASIALNPRLYNKKNALEGTTETDIINGIKTVQMWFNDQPDIHSSGNKQLEGYHHSHGKWLLSFDVSEASIGNGYIIAHSFPGTPRAYIVKSEVKSVDEWVAEVRQASDGILGGRTNIFTRSQHAICYNIKKNQMKTVLEKYSATLPKFAFINVDMEYLSQKLPGSDYEILHSLHDISVHDESGRCISDWHKLVIKNNNLDTPKETFGYQTPESCVGSFDVSGTLKLIFHAPTPHTKEIPYAVRSKITTHEIENRNKRLTNRDTKKRKRDRVKEEKRDEVERTEKRLVHATLLGPVPWLATSKVIGDSLYYGGEKPGSLPSIQARKNGVYIINEYSITAKYTKENGEEDTIKKSFNFGTMHEKIGIAATTNHVCFGDSNHRVSEITHSGVHACFQNEQLATSLRNGISRVIALGEGLYEATPRGLTSAVFSLFSGDYPPNLKKFKLEEGDQEFTVLANVIPEFMETD